MIFFRHIGNEKHMKKIDYEVIFKHYEKTLIKHGATHKGMDWPEAEDLDKRFKVMLGIMDRNRQDQKAFSLLDLGCGVGLMVDYIEEPGLENQIEYFGVDISEKMVLMAKDRWQEHSFEARDIFLNPLPPNSYDFVTMNGVLTEKVSLSQEEMLVFAKNIIKEAYLTCKFGVAFNVMSTHVDWTREYLFHWSLDSLFEFLTKEVSRNIVVRMDYGLYEYTVYVFKTAME